MFENLYNKIARENSSGWNVEGQSAGAYFILIFNGIMSICSIAVEKLTSKIIFK